MPIKWNGLPAHLEPDGTVWVRADDVQKCIDEALGAKFIRCQSPTDILVIPDGTDHPAYSNLKDPCHNHRIMRECEYRVGMGDIWKKAAHFVENSIDSRTCGPIKRMKIAKALLLQGEKDCI